MNLRRSLILVLLGVLVVNLGFSIFLYNVTSDLESQVEAVESDHDQLEDQYTAVVAGNQSGEFSSPPSARSAVPTYDSSQNAGGMVSVTITATPSEGVYFHSDTIVFGEQFQSSLLTAMSVVQETEYHPGFDGYIVTLDTPESWERVVGESASLSVGMVFASLDPELEYNENVTATGILREDGSVGRVMDVPDKIDAAASVGYEAIIVPHGQGQDHSDIDVVEVTSFGEAASVALTNSN